MGIFSPFLCPYREVIIIREVAWFKWHNWFSYLFPLTDLSSNVLSSQVKKMISSNYQFCRAHLGLCKSSCILCASTMLSPRIKCLQSGRSHSCFVANVQGRTEAHLPLRPATGSVESRAEKCMFPAGAWLQERNAGGCVWGTIQEGYSRLQEQQMKLMKGMLNEITRESLSLHKGWVEGLRSIAWKQLVPWAGCFTAWSCSHC